MSSCRKQCHGCAYLPGATANMEAGNKLTGILSSLGGIPFHCHEALGWTPDRAGYSDGQKQILIAVDNLMAAPKLVYDSPDLVDSISDCTPTGLALEIFNEDRQRIGKDPVCKGWQSTVKSLAERGWFRDPQMRREIRKLASKALILMDQFSQCEKSKRAIYFEDVRKLIVRLAFHLETYGIRFQDLVKEV